MLVHPVKVAVLEALEDHQPLTPSDLYWRLGYRWSLGTISYHVRQLAEKGLVRCVHTEPSRGSVAHFYAPTRHASVSAKD